MDVNKAPQLRELIGQIIQFLGSTHIEQIVSGLYDFKFRKKITEEISFLSKISEAESAAFNFTLDESLPIKQYYNRKLNDLLSIYRSTLAAFKEGNFINSVAFVRMILGDLHYYDEEFDHAILEYLEAVQELKRLQPEELGIPRLVLMIRNYLKLGLAYEKKRTHDSAFVLYGNLTTAIIRGREIDVEALGLKESWREDTEFYLSPRTGDPRFVGSKTDARGSELNRVLEGVDFRPALAELAYKAAAFEGIRLLYQPFLAKLQIVEKSSLGGISPWDVRRNQRELDFITKMFDKQTAVLITAEFYNKVGDILFYKNGPSPQAMRRVERQQEVDGALPIYCAQKDAVCEENRRVRGLWTRGIRTPCAACGYSMKALDDLCQKVFFEDRRRG